MPATVARIVSLVMRAHARARKEGRGSSPPSSRPSGEITHTESQNEAETVWSGGNGASVVQQLINEQEDEHHLVEGEISGSRSINLIRPASPSAQSSQGPSARDQGVIGIGGVHADLVMGRAHPAPVPLHVSQGLSRSHEPSARDQSEFGTGGVHTDMVMGRGHPSPIPLSVSGGRSQGSPIRGQGTVRTGGVHTDMIMARHHPSPIPLPVSQGLTQAQRTPESDHTRVATHGDTAIFGKHAAPSHTPRGRPVENGSRGGPIMSVAGSISNRVPRIHSTNGDICRGSGPWVGNKKMDKWCQLNCGLGFCPASTCSCD